MLLLLQVCWMMFYTEYQSLDRCLFVHQKGTAPLRFSIKGQGCCVGQSNDAIFKYARAGRVTCKVATVKEALERSLVLSSGEEVPADVIVVAYGLKYQAEPECLKELGIGGTSRPLLSCMRSTGHTV